MTHSLTHSLGSTKLLEVIHCDLPFFLFEQRSYFVFAVSAQLHAKLVFEFLELLGAN